MIDRRGLLGAAATVPAVAALHSNLGWASHMQDRSLAVAEITVDELREWIASLPDQVEGKVGPCCETGEEYVEFFTSALCRPDDVDLMWRKVATEMRDRLRGYLSERKGRIHWRIPLDWDLSDAKVILRYDENGPDIDWLTSRRCVSDKNWRRVALYTRMVRA